MMKQSVKQRLINKLPQQAMDATLSTRGYYRVDFLFKFLHEISFECPLSLSVAWGLCVCLN